MAISETDSRQTAGEMARQTKFTNPFQLYWKCLKKGGEDILEGNG